MRCLGGAGRYADGKEKSANEWNARRVKFMANAGLSEQSASQPSWRRLPIWATFSKWDKFWAYSVPDGVLTCLSCLVNQDFTFL